MPGYLTDGPAVGTHFVVHYTSSPSHPADEVSSADAVTLLADAETAYSYYVAQWGYPPPRDDGDGKTDIYVFHIPVGPVAGPDSTTSDQTSGYVIIDPTAVNQYAIAHEFFHVVQFGIYQHGGFISESSAEWAGQAVVAATGGSPPPNWYPDPQTSLDCLGSSCGDAPGGYRGSIFWEFLSERFGMGFVHDVYDRDAARAITCATPQLCTSRLTSRPGLPRGRSSSPIRRTDSPRNRRISAGDRWQHSNGRRSVAAMRGLERLSDTAEREQLVRRSDSTGGSAPACWAPAPTDSRRHPRPAV